jgi:hypothetical protein
VSYDPASDDIVDFAEDLREPIRERIKLGFEKMFVAPRWKFDSLCAFNMKAENIMSVDALVNEVGLVIVADELPGMLKEYKNRPDMAYQYVAALLVQSYKYLYTKAPLLNHVVFLLPQNSCGRALAPIVTFLRILFQYILTAIALVLFAAADKKRHYSQADIIVSYILLVGAIVLDLLPVFTSIVSYARKPFRPGTAAEWADLCLANCITPQGWQTTKQWSEELTQYSMIRRYCTSSNAWIPSLLKWIIAKYFGAWCVEFFDTTRTPVTNDLKLLIFNKLMEQTSREDWDIASSRGERALKEWMGRPQAPESRRSGYAALHMSVSSSIVDFSRSVLIWHMATDICYFSEDIGPVAETNELKKKKMMMSRELSLYIMYLVFKCDVMLTSTSRLAHKKAHEDLKKFISGRQSPQGNLGEKEAIMAMKKKEQQRLSKPPVAHHHGNNSEEPAANGELLRSTVEALFSPVSYRSWAVAEELLAIEDEVARWDLISEVWLEMLFYTAPRCGAAFHYEHLSTGGEFISHVLLLMHHLGLFSQS